MKPDIELPPGHVWDTSKNVINFVHADGALENVGWVDYGGEPARWELVYTPVGVKFDFVYRAVDTEQEGWELLVAWKNSTTQIEIFAQRTVWNHEEEAVYWLLTRRNNLKVWKNRGGATRDFWWEHYATFDTTQEAIDVMAALCWLGEADYTLLPEEGDGKQPA